MNLQHCNVVLFQRLSFRQLCLHLIKSTLQAIVISGQLLFDLLTMLTQIVVRAFEDFVLLLQGVEPHRRVLVLSIVDLLLIAQLLIELLLRPLIQLPLCRKPLVLLNFLNWFSGRGKIFMQMS